MAAREREAFLMDSHTKPPIHEANEIGLQEMKRKTHKRGVAVGGGRGSDKKEGLK